jgi:hypothetical protein
MTRRVAILVSAVTWLIAGAVAPSAAYMCESLFTVADDRIKEAEAKVHPDTDVRIKQKLAEAKGLLESAKIGHRQATERHTGAAGKYSHGDAVRQARWAESLASEVIFLASGEPR